MSKLKSLTIPDHHKVQAKATLNEVIDEEPDTVIALCFWKDRNQFKIKCSAIQDRLTLIGALEESKNHILVNGHSE